MRVKQIIIWTFLCFFVVSCKEEYAAIGEKTLVVEGWIDSGDYPVVLVTTSVPISDKEQQLEDVDEYLLKWAKVTISDGEELVTLTGKVDTCYMPPYIFTTGKMKGIPGRTYQLTVSYKDLYAEAETTIPNPLSIDSFAVSQVENDSLYQLKAYFQDNETEENFYKFFIRIKGQDEVMRPTFLGTISDEVLNNRAEVSIYQPLRLFYEEYTPFYHRDDSVAVKFSHMDKGAYQFWKKYDELQSFSGVMFFPYTNSLPSNIKGGIGYWFGYGSTTYYLDLKSYIHN